MDLIKMNFNDINIDELKLVIYPDKRLELISLDVKKDLVKIK